MPTLSQLLEVGAHFGHKKERSHPRAKDFVYAIRDSVYVIDLEQTLEKLEQAIEYLKSQIDTGKTVLFVGTKRQAKEAIKKTAESLAMPYIVERWLGGTLTNFETISKSLKQLVQLEELMKSEEFTKYTKKERRRIEKKVARLNALFEGIKELKFIPDVLFVVDVAAENVVTSEAKRMNIPIVGICDTNADPTLINYPIPANDDSEKTIKLILQTIEAGIKGTPVKISKKESETKPKEDVNLSTELASSENEKLEVNLSTPLEAKEEK